MQISAFVRTGKRKRKIRHFPAADCVVVTQLAPARSLLVGAPREAPLALWKCKRHAARGSIHTHVCTYSVCISRFDFVPSLKDA